MYIGRTFGSDEPIRNLEKRWKGNPQRVHRGRRAPGGNPLRACQHVTPPRQTYAAASYTRRMKTPSPDWPAIKNERSVVKTRCQNSLTLLRSQ